MAKRRHRMSADTFSCLFCSLVLVLLFTGIALFLYIPFLKELTMFPGVIMYANNKALGEEIVIYSAYGKAFVHLILSLIPLIFIPLIALVPREKLQTFLMVLVALALLAIDIVLYSIPTSPLRTLKETSEFYWFEDTMLLRYVGRWFTNFASVYVYYPLFPVVQILAFFLIVTFVFNDHTVLHFFAPFLFMIIILVGLAILIFAIAFLSLIGMIAAIALFAVCGGKICGPLFEPTHEYVGTSSWDGEKVYFNGSGYVDEHGNSRHGSTYYKD